MFCKRPYLDHLVIITTFNSDNLELGSLRRSCHNEHSSLALCAASSMSGYFIVHAIWNGLESSSPNLLMPIDAFEDIPCKDCKATRNIITNMYRCYDIWKEFHENLFSCLCFSICKLKGATESKSFYVFIW